MSDKTFAILFTMTGFSLGFSVCALTFYSKPTPPPCPCCAGQASIPHFPTNGPTVVLPNSSGTITVPQNWEPSGTTTIPLAAEDRP